MATAEKSTAPVETAKVEDKARNVVSATISDEVYEKFEDYRWTHRLTKSQVVAKAIEELVKNQ